MVFYGRASELQRISRQQVAVFVCRNGTDVPF